MGFFNTIKNAGFEYVNVYRIDSTEVDKASAPIKVFATTVERHLHSYMQLNVQYH